MTESLFGPVVLTRRELSGQRCAAKREWHNHRKGCYECRTEQSDPAQWCNDGYELARALHLAHKALVAYDMVQAAQQLGLFATEKGTDNDGTD